MCVQSSRLCSSCCRSWSCQNISIPSPSSPALFETVARSSPQMSDLATDSHPSDDDESLVDPHLSPQASPIPVTDLQVTLTDVNRKMTKAFGCGSILVQDDTLCNNPWTDRWQTITQHSGRHYSLRRGACGQHYINHLCDEILHLS